MKKITTAALFAMAAMVSAACTDGLDGLGFGETSEEVVSTNLTAYQTGNDITVTYSNMGGAATDWIGISLTTDAPDVYRAWKFTGGGASGTMTFTAPTLAPGTYEARAYYDWAGTSSYTIQQRSPAFTVSGNATLTPSQTAYPMGATVPINFTGFTGSTTDWIAIYTPGAPDTSYVTYQYTGGGMAGTVNFMGLEPGLYEARYFPDYAGTQTVTSFAKSPQFVVGGTTSIATDSPSYGAGSPVTVTYTNMPGNMKDWVAISAAGSPATSYIQWFYTNGQINGTQQFTGLPTGNYEARAYVNDTFTILATYAFTVTGTSVTTDKALYTNGEPVVVTYSGMPANMTDWIAVATVGSPDTSYVQWEYSNGTSMGTTTFMNLPAGTYEARAYYNNTYTVGARSAAFTVGTTCSMPANPPVLEAVTHGTLTIPAGENEGTVAMTPALDRSILFSSVREAEASPAHGSVLCELRAADVDAGTTAGISCRRQNIGTDNPTISTGAIEIAWSVATFTSGVTVQRGLASSFASTTVTLPTAVDMASSFVLLNGQRNGGSGWGSNEFSLARLTSATSLEVRPAVMGTQNSWQVVTVNGAQVQRGTEMLSSAETFKSVPITTAPSGSIVLASYTSDNAGSIAAGALMLRADIEDPSAVSLVRNFSGTTMEVSWEVVSLPFATQHGIANFAAGVSAATAAVPGFLNATSVALGSSMSVLGQSGGSTAYGGAFLDLVGEASFTFGLNAGILNITRGSSTASAVAPWNVIDFSRDCAGN